MNKFATTLSSSNDSIKEARAKSLADTTVLEVESFIQTLKREKNQLTNQINNLTDLAPENTYSLRPGSPNFNAAAWVKELHTTRMNLKLKAIELEEAQAIFDEWFATNEAV